MNLPTSALIRPAPPAVVYPPSDEGIERRDWRIDLLWFDWMTALWAVPYEQVNGGSSWS